MAVILRADEICEGLKRKIKTELESVGKLSLASLLIGQEVSEYYQAQKKLAEELGVDFPVIPPTISFSDLKSKVEKLNNDPKVTGIILNKPFLPEWKEQDVFSLISPEKDVEGMNPVNFGKLSLGKSLFIPPTVLSVLELIRSKEVNLRGKRVTIVNSSNIIGKPLALLLVDQLATVSITHIATSQAGDLETYVRGADILISAAGVPALIKGDWVKEGAIVVDVGTAQRQGKLTGDVEFDQAKEKAAAITPVPGGVGKLTTMFLFRNLLTAALEVRK